MQHSGRPTGTDPQLEEIMDLLGDWLDAVAVEALLVADRLEAGRKAFALLNEILGDQSRRLPISAMEQRTDAVLAVLEDAEGPLTVVEICRRLRGAGRSDAPKDVSATLSHLRKRGRVVPAASSTWRPSPRHLT